MTIKAVFFDAAGTLIKPERRVGESYSVIAAKHGVEASAAEIAERFRVCFDAAPRLAFPGATGEGLIALERDWWKQLVAAVFKPWDRFEHFDDFFDELFTYFATPGAWSLYPEVLETLATLKKRGMILDVISNFDSRLVRILDGLGVATSSSIFLSRVGWAHAKPDREIFDAALKHHGLNAEQCPARRRQRNQRSAWRTECRPARHSCRSRRSILFGHPSTNSELERPNRLAR